MDVIVFAITLLCFVFMFYFTVSGLIHFIKEGNDDIIYAISMWWKLLKKKGKK